MDKNNFNLEQTQKLADELAKVLNSYKLSSVEKVYAVSALFRGIGEALYDLSDKSFSAVLKDYQSSPSWPGALMLMADTIHDLYNDFRRKDSYEVEEQDVEDG